MNFRDEISEYFGIHHVMNGWMDKIYFTPSIKRAPPRQQL